MTVNVTPIREDLIARSPALTPDKGLDPNNPRQFPGSLILFLLLHVMDQNDGIAEKTKRIDRRCRRIERKVNRILCHLCQDDYDLSELDAETDED